MSDYDCDHDSGNVNDSDSENDDTNEYDYVSKKTWLIMRSSEMSNIIFTIYKSPHKK